jgi:hypothetical protein
LSYIAHDHFYDLIMMSYINSYSCYENPQDSSYNATAIVGSSVPSLRKS